MMRTYFQTIIAVLSLAVIVACSGGDKSKSGVAGGEVASDGFDAAICNTIRNTSAADASQELIDRMVEQAKILKPQFEPDSKADFRDEQDSISRHQAYDDVSGKLYELILLNRIDRKTIDEINGYEQLEVPQ